MKRTANKLFIYTLSSIAVLASCLAAAETRVIAPSLEGGMTATVGTFYVAPSADTQDYALQSFIGGTYLSNTGNIVEVNPGYNFGFEAALGYIFADTANGVELLYRTVETHDNDSVYNADETIYSPIFDDDYTGATSSLKYELNAIDLMFNQFINLGQAVQMRFSAGASFVDLEKKQNSKFNDDDDDADLFQNNSKYNGVGPRVATDGRYDFGQGFGIVGGASLAFFTGDMDVHDTFSSFDSIGVQKVKDDLDNHIVTNLRGNLGIDYVYFFNDDELSAVGIELGYMVDYYADAITQLNYADVGGEYTKDLADYTSYLGSSDSNSLTFSGPYLNLKGAF